MRHVLSAVVENKPGVLSRITGLFSRRGFNIESLTVAPTEDERYSRLVAVIEADDLAFEQITKQLHKLVNVLKISDLAKESAIERVTAFIRVKADAENRREVADAAEFFKAKIVDVGVSQLTIECLGDEQKIEDLIAILKPYGILDIVRTGVVAIARSEK